MSHTRITKEELAREKVLKGVNQLCDLVKTTLGPAGKTVILNVGYGSPLATKDGVTVAKSISLLDPVEDIGAQVVKEVSIKSNTETGDGTTTAAVIAQALVKSSFNLLNSKEVKNVNLFRKGMMNAMLESVERIEKESFKIPEGKKAFPVLKKIAMISSNSDEEIAELIVEALKIIGDTGAIKMDVGQSHKSYVQTAKGLTYGNGMMSPYLAEDHNRMQWRFKNVIVFCTNFRITHISEIANLLEYCTEKKRPLLIICDDMDEAALRLLAMNVHNGHIKACAVKHPGFGSQVSERLEDIATMTGGSVVFKDRAEKLADINDSPVENYIGRAGSVIVKQNEFSIIEGEGDSKAIEDRKQAIKRQIAEADDEYMKGKHEERLAKMTSGVAMIYVGDYSEIAAKEKRDRMEDALRAVKVSQEKGYIAGGGLKLLELAMSANMELSPDSTDEEKGRYVFFESIKQPFHQILSNAYITEQDAISLGNSKDNFTHGFDLFDLSVINYLEKGILDPAKVTISALKNAVSICSTLVTMSGTVHIISENSKPDDLT